MNQEQQQKLATQLNLDLAFVSRLVKMFKIQKEQDLYRKINEIKQIQAENEIDNIDDAIDYAVLQESGKQRAAEYEEYEQSLNTTSGSPIQSSDKPLVSVSQELKSSPTLANTQPQGTSPTPGVMPQNVPTQGGLKGRQELTTSLFGYPVDPVVRFGEMNDVDIHTGGRNTGEDYAVPVGTELYVPPGKYQVVSTHSQSQDNSLNAKNMKKRSENFGYGNQVVLKDLETGEEHRYNHLSSVNVKPGQTIDGGTVMAKTGATGNVVGVPHLDYEIFDRDTTGKLRLKSPDKWRAFDETGKLTREITNPKAKGQFPQSALATIRNISNSPQEQSQTPASNGQIARLADQSLATGQRALQTGGKTQISGTVDDQILSLLPQEQREAAKTIAPSIAQALDREGILTPQTLAYALATASHESGMVPKQEVMAQRGLNAKNDYIADLQDNYSGGKKYVGRGLIQLTHDYNYKKYGDRIGVDLVSNPDALLDPDISARVLAAYIKDSGVAEAVEKGDLIKARVRVQGQGATNSKFMPTTRKIAQQAQQLAHIFNAKPDAIAQLVQPRTPITSTETLKQLPGNQNSITSMVDQGEEERPKSLLDVFMNTVKNQKDTINEVKKPTIRERLNNTLSSASQAAKRMLVPSPQKVSASTNSFAEPYKMTQTAKQFIQNKPTPPPPRISVPSASQFISSPMNSVRQIVNQVSSSPKPQSQPFNPAPSLNRAKQVFNIPQKTQSVPTRTTSPIVNTTRSLTNTARSFFGGGGDPMYGKYTRY